MSSQQPHVTVITPVYNGEAYLAECIESVLAQRYTNWDYVIVNNCSTDKSLDIASRYAESNPRIRIVNNATFVDVVESHNIAFRQLSPESKYCKIVSADDSIYPEYLERLVAVAERHPSVGLVGCYGVTNKGIRVSDVPLGTEMFSGESICRMHLLGSQILSAYTSVLYRADLIRTWRPFFTVSVPSADIHWSFEVLRHSDFGFVHQILYFERLHEASVSSKLETFNSFLVDRLDYVISYGAIFLSPQEMDFRLEELLTTYYDYLADRAIHFAGHEFWTYHRNRLASLGHPIDSVRLARAVSLRVLGWFANPQQTLQKLLGRLHGSSATLTLKARNNA
ncbi:MAG TPA: glycosyltransferase family 2 protein [Pyrinomonadaceae bacterium]